MDRETANNILQKWVDILGLRDWRIKLVYNALPCDMKLDRCDGETEWNECRKIACIRILDEKSYGDFIVGFNFERTLIHELLHLKMSLMGESGNDLQDRLVHQLIDDLARAFCEAAGGGKETLQEFAEK